jgi:6-phosphogluconolactonase (cycloisomerase 2 family)
VAPPTVNAGAGASSVTIDPTGTYAYVTNRGTTTLSQFTIGTGGGLVAIAPTTVAAGLHPTSIATGY